jgi:hypothetical protein|tara:strand:- start:821 stop:979 length:159 start_codon:yes stop_codon:yes gene_type:complete
MAVGTVALVQKSPPVMRLVAAELVAIRVMVEQVKVLLRRVLALVLAVAVVAV